MELKRNTGITLVGLIVSIIVMLILAGVSINAVVGDNGILTQAITASILTRYSAYVENLQMSLIDGDTPTCSGTSMTTYISSMEDSDLENFVIINGELYYIGSNSQEKEVAESAGINTDLSGADTADIIAIVQYILPEETKTGKALYDKTAANSETWGVVTDYDESYEQTGKYGTGYYYLASGTYTINDETITLSGNYIIDYEGLTLIELSSRYVLWSLDTTIAVTNGLVLNIDPSNLADIEYEEVTVTDDAVAVANGEESATAYQLYENGEDLGITMYGDVVYDEENNALVFNESEDNPLITEDGDTAGGGYMKLVKDDDSIDFSEGFTFEIYANLSRLTYNNGSGQTSLGLFCRINTLYSDYQKAMRFGNWSAKLICKLYNNSSWTGTGNNLCTTTGIELLDGSLGYDKNEDFYLTYVYRIFNGETADEYQKEYYDENNIMIDKVEYYINGELYGYTYHGHDSYESGLNYWNYSSFPFYLGVCPWTSTGNLYYLKGTVYTARLYTYSMTEEEVAQNRALTLTYRESFQ